MSLQTQVKVMENLKKAYKGQEMGAIWGRMRAVWARDVPTRQLNTYLTAKLQEVQDTMPPPPLDDESEVFRGLLEASLREDTEQGPPALPDGGQILRSTMTVLPKEELPEATEASFSAYLKQEHGVQIPITKEAYETIPVHLRSAFVAASSPLLYASTFLHSSPEGQDMDEEKTTQMMGNLVPNVIRETNQALAGVGASLSHYKWSGNKSAKRRTISIGVDPARRPDHLSYAEDATMLAGKDKGAKDRIKGREQLEEYVQGGFQSAFFGRIKFIACYHSWGSCCNFGFFTQAGEVSWCNKYLDFMEPEARVLGMLAIMKLMRLWASTKDDLPPLANRIKLLAPWKRNDMVTVQFLGHRVFKQIQPFNKWVHDHSPGTTEAAIQTAYSLGNTCTSIVKTVGDGGSARVKTRGLYTVSTEQLGPIANPISHHDCWALAKCALEATSLLHQHGIVHRDPRMPNFVTRDGTEGAYTLIDMEQVADTSVPWRGDLLSVWDDKTLNQAGVYDILSESRQVGKLLENLPVQTEDLKDLIEKLKTKQITCLDSLQHAFIVNEPMIE